LTKQYENPNTVKVFRHIHTNGINVNHTYIFQTLTTFAIQYYLVLNQFKAQIHYNQFNKFNF